MYTLVYVLVCSCNRSRLNYLAYPKVDRSIARISLTIVAELFQGRSLNFRIPRSVMAIVMVTRTISRIDSPDLLNYEYPREIDLNLKNHNDKFVRVK